MIWLAVVALAAQTTTAAGAQAQSGATADKKITVTGCVERADQMNGADTLGTTVDSMQFVLVNIPSEAVGTTGVKTGERPTMDKGYRLDGKTAELNAQVGHKVEITGFVDAPAATNATASSVNGPMVKVQSIRMLSETCGR